MTRRIATFGIGSTNFRYAIGSPTDGFLTEITTNPTVAEDLVTTVQQAIQTLRDDHGEIDAVSIATTGLVDRATGTITELDTANGESVTDVRVGAMIDREFGLPTVLANDCTAAALGEYVFGDGQDHDCVIHVTFGTGIGGGVVEDGRALRGEDGHAGEVGLIPVLPTGDGESFGVRGAWEAYCSGRGIPEYVQSLLADEERATALRSVEQLTAKALFAAAADGDTVANEYVDSIGRLNAAGLGALINAYNPGLITLGGGVALNNADAVLSGIHRSLDDYVFVPEPDLKITTLGDHIGLYGALAPFVNETAATPL